jgi:hypothetical protein
MDRADSKMKSLSCRPSIFLFGWFEMDDSNGAIHILGHEANLIAGFHLVQPGNIGNLE